MILHAATRVRNSLKSRYEIGSRRRRQTRLRNRNRGKLPPLNAFDQAIVEALEQDGGAITSLAELGAGGEFSDFDTRAAFDMLAGPKKTADYPKDFFQEASLAQLACVPQLIKWGLEERFLAIAHNYFGLPAAYRGLILRRDFADGICRETRQWHRDSEDVRILKIIVHITDVDENGGAFRFLPRAHAPKKGIAYVNGRVPENIMGRLVSADKYVTCVGLAGTVVFADTASVWHHGCVPESADRLTAFYAYNSHCPLRPHYCQPLFPAHYLGGDKLSPMQAAAIDYSYPVTSPRDGAEAA